MNKKILVNVFALVLLAFALYVTWIDEPEIQYISLTFNSSNLNHTFEVKADVLYKINVTLIVNSTYEIQKTLTYGIVPPDFAGEKVIEFDEREINIR